MKKISCLIMTAVLLLGLTACSGNEKRLYAGYCTYYADGGLMSYCEYYYENVKVEKGSTSVFDFRDDERELDPRATVVY